MVELQDELCTRHCLQHPAGGESWGLVGGRMSPCPCLCTLGQTEAFTKIKQQRQTEIEEGNKENIDESVLTKSLGLVKKWTKQIFKNLVKMLHLQIKTKYNTFHGFTSKINYLSARACVCEGETVRGRRL